MNCIAGVKNGLSVRLYKYKGFKTTYKE